MALHPDFPKYPYAILDPEIRWFPAYEDLQEDFEKYTPTDFGKLVKTCFGTG